MKKIIITETQLKTLIKRRSLNESPILYPLPTDKNPEADEIDFEDLQAAGDMYDRLKSGEDSDNKLNVDVVGGKFVDPEDIHKMNHPKGMEGDMEDLQEAGTMVDAENRVDYLENALKRVWNMGKSNNTIDLKSMAQSLINDMFGELEEEPDYKMPGYDDTMDAINDLGIREEETFGNTDFGLNLNEGQIKLKKTFNKFMKNPIIKNLGDTI